MIFGKRLSDYVRFAKLFMVLVRVVGLIRLALSLAGVSNSTVRWFSMTGLGWIGIVYYAIRVHTTGFGSYKQLLPVLALVNWVAQAVAVVGILIAIFTGMDNIFSAPEYAFGSDGKTWFHVGAHLIVGTTVGSLVPWIIGSVIMAITKKVHRNPAPKFAV